MPSTVTYHQASTAIENHFEYLVYRWLKTTLQAILRNTLQTSRELWHLLQHLFSCTHPNALMREGKCYCPDCGEGIVHRWQLLRCAGCNTRRDVTYRFRQWSPTHPYCPACGDSHVLKETLDNPRYHQLHLAYLVAIPAKEFENEFSQQVNIFQSATKQLLRQLC